VTSILVVDDEPQIVRALRASLLGHGYEVATAALGQEALSVAADHPPDLVILDLGLPDLDGVQVLESLRRWSSVPVIVLSVREAQSDKVAALDAGADDYLAKPFGMDELLARIRAALRRAATEDDQGPILRFDDLVVDLPNRSVHHDGRPIHLTPIEFSLLEAMVTHPGKLLTHAWLLERVWGRGYRDATHYLRVYVRQLRRKLGDAAAAPRLIATDPGIGYRWLPDPDPGGDR
jgi:two-component system KDP operon response regulator KdpE